MIATLKLYGMAIAGAFAIGIGALLCYVIYAKPEVAHLEATIAAMKAADEKATADFQSAARAQERKAEDEKQQIETKYLAAQHQRDEIIAGLAASARSVRDAANAYAIGDACRLPKADGAPSIPDDRARVLASLLGEGADLLAEGAGDAGRAADQIRALQALEVAK